MVFSFLSDLNRLSLALDPFLHTTDFVRRSSPFLLTAICACAAQFAPNSNQALAKRLQLHFDRSARTVMSHGYRSVAVVHAFLIGTGWACPSPHIADERAWTYISYAANLAVELGLNSSLRRNIDDKTPASSRTASVTPERPACKVSGPSYILGLSLEEEMRWHGIEPESEVGRRLMRSQQRCWLHLYLWGSG
jgi:hypothetical protein